MSGRAVDVERRRDYLLDVRLSSAAALRNYFGTQRHFPPTGTPVGALRLIFKTSSDEFLRVRRMQKKDSVYV